jgi:hypothetical protein
MGMIVTPSDLAHVYWIGGSPCSGKSSIAEALADAYDLQLYKADDAYVRHAQVVTHERQPTFYRLVHFSPEELWMRPVEEQVADARQLYLEEFPMIVDDLLALPTSRPILAEGAALLPECVAPLLLEPHSAIWIVPTPEFQVEHYARRAWAQEVVRTCSSPQQAFQNWMQRDIWFATHVEQAARDLIMRTIVVDGTCSLIENRALVEHHFQLVRDVCRATMARR